MDPVTKKRALEKAEATDRMIGYPNFILDENKLAEYYREVACLLNIAHFFICTASYSCTFHQTSHSMSLKSVSTTGT